MLDLCRLVRLIYVTIDKFSYDINVTKIALMLFDIIDGKGCLVIPNNNFFLNSRLCIRCNICGPSGRLLGK